MAEGPRAALDAEGPAAPPRRNGELAFDAPWQSRLFGMTLALHEQGCFVWHDFRERLIAEIAAWERAHPDGAGYVYYERWLAALETLLADKAVCSRGELAARAERLAARPPGHDHDHAEQRSKE